MKRAILLSLPLAGVALWLVAQAPPPSGSLAGYFPEGAVLFTEAKDLRGLIREWDGSEIKKRWLASANYQAFSRSHLAVRLEGAQQEFAAAAGVPPDMALLKSVAGGQSALAIYDIGDLELLYITRLASARSMETLLWQSRAQYEARNAGGRPYYVRVDPSTRRVAAFAFTDEFLLLATRDDLVGGALTLMAGQPATAMLSERWYSEAVRNAGPTGDIRFVANMNGLVASPHFRSYWIQRNVSDLRQYGAAISDLHRTPSAWREDRKLIRFNEQTAPQTGDLGAVLRLVPADAGMYRAWAAPPVDEVTSLLARTLVPGPVERTSSETAPAVFATGPAGSESDLEVRIGEQPLRDSNVFSPAPLRALIETAGVRTMLRVGSTRVLAGGTWVGTRSAVALLSSTDWDQDAVKKALAASIERLLTTSALGAGWIERRAAGRSYFELDGLHGLTVAFDGKLFVIATGREAIEPVLKRFGIAPEFTDAVYAAGFRHAAHADFSRIVNTVETTLTRSDNETSDSETEEPRFFSENIASLSTALSDIESAAITVRDDGRIVSQTVRYDLRRR